MVFSHHALNALIPALIIICFGNYLYKFRDKLLIKHSVKICLAIFFMINVFRMNIICRFDGREYSYYNLLYWYSACGVLCAICIIIISMRAMNNIPEKSILGISVSAIGANTFGIYLIHFFVMDFIKSRKIYVHILNVTNTIPVRWLADSFYMAATVLVIFVFSWVIVYICKKVVYILKRITKNSLNSIQ